MRGALSGRTVAFLVAPEGFSETDLVVPWQALEQEGARTVLVSTSRGRARASDGRDRSHDFDVHATVKRATAGDFDALVLPGGEGSVLALTADAHAVALVRDMLAAGKPVGALPDAVPLLLAAEAVAARRVAVDADTEGLVRDAGGSTSSAREVVVDSTGPGVLVTGRGTDGLATFCSRLCEAVRDS